MAFFYPNLPWLFVVVNAWFASCVSSSRCRCQPQPADAVGPKQRGHQNCTVQMARTHEGWEDWWVNLRVGSLVQGHLNQILTQQNPHKPVRPGGYVLQKKTQRLLGQVILFIIMETSRSIIKCMFAYLKWRHSPKKDLKCLLGNSNIIIMIYIYIYVRECLLPKNKHITCMPSLPEDVAETVG